MVKTRLIAAALAACLLTTPAMAAPADQQSDADLLRTLGLFQGTEAGDALGQNLTRAEAAVMLVRLYGAADGMAAQTYPTPFTDLSDWSKPYVSWLYQHGLTHGTSQTTYSPNDPITKQSYLLFLGRALGYADNDTATGKSFVSAADYQAAQGQTLTRGEAVSLTVDALFSTTSSGVAFSAVLIEQGAIDAETFALAAGDRPTIPAVNAAALQNSVWDVRRMDNGQVKVVRRQDDKVRATSNRTFDRAITTTGVDGIFAYDSTTLYYLDPETLSDIKIADLSSFFDETEQGYIDALGSMNGTTLFCMSDPTASSAYRFYTWSPAGGWRLVLSGTGVLGQVNTLSTVEGKYFSGTFGILSVGLDGSTQVLTRTPCYAMTLLGGILYFIPDASVKRTDGYSDGGREVRMLAMGKESTVLTLPTGSAYPICLETVTGASPDGTITARGTWHAADGSNEWHVTFLGKGSDVRVVDADNQHNVPDDLNGLYSASEHMKWWANTLGLTTGKIAQT